MDDWRKSSHSISNGQCVEVAASAGVVLVRDTVDRDGVKLSFSPGAWSAFTARAAGEPGPLG